MILLIEKKVCVCQAKLSVNDVAKPIFNNE